MPSKDNNEERNLAVTRLFAGGDFEAVLDGSAVRKAHASVVRVGHFFAIEPDTGSARGSTASRARILKRFRHGKIVAVIRGMRELHSCKQG